MSPYASEGVILLFELSAARTVHKKLQLLQLHKFVARCCMHAAVLMANLVETPQPAVFDCVLL